MVRNVFILWMILVVLLAGTGSHAQNIRFQQNIRGGFAIAGNSLLNNSTSSFLNTAGGNTKSSSADLVLPAGSTIEKAYLYVEGYTGTKMTSVRFRVPGGAYVTYNTTSPGFLGNPGSAYQQFMVDVTSVVSPTGYISTEVPGGDPSGNGRYAVADPTPTGFNQGYGWSLIVVYTNPASKFRSVTIADNNAAFGLSTQVSLTVNNVSVPSSGPVTAVVGITGCWGDVGLSDIATFGPIPGTATNLADPFTGATNDILNSTIAFAPNNNVSADGGAAMSGNFTGRTPYLFTNPGSSSNTSWSSYFYDADILNASGILPNSATPINVRFVQASTGGDALGSGSYAIAVDIAAAVLTKAVSPSAIAPGGVATYTFTISNTQAAAINLTNIGFTDNLPSGLRIANPANAVLTGGSGGTITATAGGTSISLAGLSLAAGQTATVTVEVTNVPGQTNPSCAANPAAFTNGLANITSVSPNLANGVTDQCLIVTPLPPPPDTDTVHYCQGGAAVPLTATGSNLLWYTAATGGTGTATAPTPSTATPGTTTWYVSQTVGGLESPRSPAVVIVHPTPSAPVVSSPVIYCQGATAAPLTATGSNLLWYTAAAGGTGTAAAPVPSTATPGTTTWYVSQTVDGCEGPRASLSVVVNAKPAAPVVSSPVVYCQGATAAPLTATGSGLLWYTAATGGTGTATAPTPSTATPGTTTWHVSQTVNGCEGPRSPISVTVNPTMVVSTTAQICPGGSYPFGSQTITAAGTYTETFANVNGCDSVVTLTMTVGNTIQVNLSRTICQGESTSFNGMVYTTAGSYSYTTNSSGGCDSVTTLNLTVNPNVTPTFTAAGPICSGATAPVLPATSNNGIAGTWNPSTVSNTATGTYTFTPNAGQCATTTTLTVTVNPNITPTFTTAAPICAGATAPVLPATSNNGIAGTWNPGTVSNTATGTYTFTPNAGQCATTTTLTVTVNPNVTPTFTTVAPICSGATAPVLPATSNNGIAGTWNPSTVSNTATGTYTFTPNAGQCATTTTLTVTVNPNVTPTFTTVAPICSGATAPVLPATSNNGIAGTWNPGTVSNTATDTYTFTPNAGQCATTTTLTVTVNPNVTPTFTTVAPICSGATAPVLPATSNNGITGTWNPGAVSNTATGTYTFTPNAGQCATTTTLTVTVNPNVTPTFTAITPICSGATSPVLPATSNNGIAGTWNPGAVSNTATGTYTFTPDAGQCATTTTLTVTVNPAVTATQSITVCAAQLPYPWNGQSLTASGTYTHTQPNVNGCDSTTTLTFTVNPTINTTQAITVCETQLPYPWNGQNLTASGTYTHTQPNAAGCDSTMTLSFTVNSQTTPTFTTIAPICSGATAPVLPATSNNGIAGTWNPGAVSNTATGTYTFTPNAGQCATTTTMTVTVNPNVTPTFTAITPICSGATAPVLPTTSNNGITGTWNPGAVSNTATGTYTFTPDAGQCATTTTLTVTVNPAVTATQSITVCAAQLPYPWNGQSLTAAGTYTHTQPNGNGCDSTTTLTFTVNPTINTTQAITVCETQLPYPWNGQNLTASGTYTHTQPNAAGCDSTMTLTFTVNNQTTPTFTAAGPICAGATAPVLPATSNNGIAGTWNPGAVSNTATGTYTFTPNAGQCATTTTLTVTVNPNVTPTFTAAGPICSGTTAPVLPATSNNGITGTWSPSTVSNTATGTYTFTPNAGQCATTTTLTVTVNPAVTATQSITVCAAQLPYPWNGQSLTAAGTYTHTQPNVNGCDSTTTLTFTVNPTINTTQAITVCETQLPYPWNGQNLTASGTYTHTQPNAAGCDSTMTLTFTVNSQTTPTFTTIAPICSGATAPVLPATSNNGITGTWNPGAVSNTATGTYTFTPNAGQCATTTTMTVTVNPNVTPTFTAITPICSGTTAPVLPTTSNNGITGTWNPGAVSNTATGTYTFTPNAGQCATTTTLTVTVNPAVTATQSITVCAAQLPYPWNGQSLTAAGTYTHTQPNGNGCDSTTTLTFTVNPTINTTQAITVCETQLPYPWNGQNLTASGTYTHTQPNAAGCDSTMTLTFTVNSQTTPTFTAAGPICSGSTAPVLPATSNNGIAGTWNPGAVSNTATGSYTFTPNAGQCATTTTMTVTVNPNVTPTFTAITPICAGSTAPVLPTTSNNGITGTWSPGAVSNTATGTYTFTPNTGQCATATTLTIIVKPTSTATQTIAACTTQLPYPWNGQSLTASGTYTHTQPNVNGCDSTTTLTFTVNPTINTTQAITVCETQLPYPWNGQNLTASGTYTHTQPNAAGCDSTMTLTFTVNSQTTPTFTVIAPICAGATAPVLPATSNNGIAGTWNPGTVSNTATGTYTFTPNAGQCATTATLTVTVNPLPAAPAVTTPVSYCQDAPATPLSATGTNLQWYTTATGGTGTALAPTPSTATGGTTTWYVSQSANGCEGPRAAITVTIRPTPAAPSVTTPVTYCQGEAATPLSATGTSLQWYTTATGGTGTATAPTPPTTAPGTTTWYVSQAVDGCESPRAALSVIVHPLPAAPEVSSPVNYCQGDAITPLTAEGNDLRWYTEATGGVGSNTAPVPTGDAPGTQSWYVSQTENGCEGPRTKIEVIIHPAPTLDAKLDIVGTTMYLAAQATGAGLTYAWTPPDGLSCTDCDRPRADPERNTVYTVTVTTSAGCSASDTVGIYLDCNKIFIPNTFSPNGDGNNDRFYPMGLSLKQLKVFRVYNRWGELLFSRENVPANDPLYGWDGNYQSKTVKPDVFVYYLEAICTTGEVISRKGDVTIVR